MEWRKTKSMTEEDLEVLGVERERGKPAFALMAKPGSRKYVGSAFVTLNRGMRERLWKRVQEKPGSPPKEMAKRPDTQWTRPGLMARVRHLRGEEKLRHARLLDIRDEE
jgi:ATP-dependent DNA ligase